MPTAKLMHPTQAPNVQVILRNGSLVTTDAAGQVSVTADSTTAMSIIALLDQGWQMVDAASIQPQLAMKTGRFYVGGPGDLLSAQLTVASTLYLYPVFVPNALSLVALCISFTTGQAGGKGKAGLWSDLNGAPSQFIAGTDTGDLDGTGTAVRTGTLSTPVPLDAGWYWVGSCFAATSTMPSVAAFTAAMSQRTNAFMGGDTAAHALAVAATGSINGLSGTFTYGALGSLPTLSVVNNGAMPAVALSF